MTGFFLCRSLASGLVRWCFLLLVLIASAGFSFSALASNGVALASWNIERLGHGSNKDYSALGVVGEHFDFIAVQEAMTSEGLYQLQAALEAQTNEAWELIYSHRIGRSTYKEKYAFLWRPSRVKYLDGAVVYLDPGDLFAREPYSARFKDRSSGDEFAVATVHIVYGRRISDRTEEIEELARYWDWLQEIYPQTPVLLMGDFNLQPHHNAWQPLREKNVLPLITEGATTLSAVDGRYANLYDNIWVLENSPFTDYRAGILRFPELLGMTHEQARRHVSDHAPVYLLTRQAELRQSVQAASLEWQPSPQEQQPPQTATEGRLLGNRNSNIVHRPDCPSYSRVSEANRVYFATLKEAKKAGYRLAGNCPE